MAILVCYVWVGGTEARLLQQGQDAAGLLLVVCLRLLQWVLFVQKWLRQHIAMHPWVFGLYSMLPC